MSNRICKPRHNMIIPVHKAMNWSIVPPANHCMEIKAITIGLPDIIKHTRTEACWLSNYITHLNTARESREAVVLKEFGRKRQHASSGATRICDPHIKHT